MTDYQFDFNSLGMTFGLVAPELSARGWNGDLGLDLIEPLQIDPRVCGESATDFLPITSGFDEAASAGAMCANSPYDFINAPLPSPFDLAFSSGPSSSSTTPEALTPDNPIFPLAPSPVNGNFSLEGVIDPSLIGNSFGHALTNSGDLLPSDGKEENLVIPTITVNDEIPSSAGSATSLSPPPSPLPVLPENFYIVQRPSEAGRSRKAPGGRRTTGPAASMTTGRERRRSGKAKTAQAGEASTTRKDVLCPVEGCNHTGSFFDARVLSRHLASKAHNDNPKIWYCPGMCKADGFARDDSLGRHLKLSKRGTVCREAAKQWGWDPKERCSVVIRLFNVPPPPHAL